MRDLLQDVLVTLLAGIGPGALLSVPLLSSRDTQPVWVWPTGDQPVEIDPEALGDPGQLKD
ncbi:hypothetical protein [Ruania zhangjianzhongii]|uniref:hypothetical protein n=1 Tax=Ruania zhangjianzhongii TaxID=2603206 RepID=UPI001F445B93|nr:hypothetical protein [Ruania zhangjianzhongii]